MIDDKKNVNFIADAIHNLTEGMKELIDDVYRLQDRLSAWVKMVSKKPPRSIWTVEEDEKVYIVCGVAILKILEDYWKGTYQQLLAQREGRMFFTKEEADYWVLRNNLFVKSNVAGAITSSLDKNAILNGFAWVISFDYVENKPFVKEVNPFEFDKPELGVWTDPVTASDFLTQNEEDLVKYFNGNVQ